MPFIHKQRAYTRENLKRKDFESEVQRPLTNFGNYRPKES